MRVTAEGAFAELGSEQYRDINPCKLTNLLNLVAICWGGGVWRSRY